jgi:hypothetical protein
MRSRLALMPRGSYRSAAHAQPAEESAMPDDKTKRGEPDRSKVAAGETYEVATFAARHGLSMADARDLIKRHGNQRAVLDVEAKAFKKTSRRYAR